MKKRPISRVLVVIMSLLLVVTSALAVPTSAEAASKPTKITLTATKKTMYVGEKYTLKVKSVSPSKASKSVTYKTSNKSVATVSSKGQIVAKKKGTATITVTSKVNTKVKATCKVTVKQQVKKITVTNAVNNTVAVRIGKSLTLKTSVSPSNASSKKLTFTSSDKKIATVTSSGKITAKKAGTAKITIKSADGKAKTTITVKVPDKKKAVTKVTISTTKRTVKVGDKFTLKATISPSNATVKTVSWKSSKEKVATVDSKGKVTAKAPGTAVITVTTLDGSKTAKCTVTVKPILVTKVALNKSSASLNIGGKLALKASVSPSNATTKTVKWTSSNTKVATVDSKGNVTAKALGTATITATATDGSKKSANCKITVNPILVSGITLSRSTATLDIGKTVTLTAVVAPSNATNKAVTWSSSNTGVATVANGVVTAKAAGTAVITATAADGSKKSASCTITVKNPVIEITGVTLSGDTEIYANTVGAKLTATVAPANTTMSKEVTFTSENEAYLTVEEDGTLVPDMFNLAGVTEDSITVAVTAVTVNGKTATCDVTIILRKRANSDENKYSFTLDKNAASYDVTRNDRTLSVTPESIGADIETLAGIAWSNDTLKNNWNDAGIQKVMSLVLAEEFGLAERVDITVVDNTMEMTTRNKTVVVNRIDNTDGTSSLEILTGDKTVYLENITITGTEPEAVNYVVNMTAKAGSTTQMLEVIIAKDATSVIVNQKYSDGDTDKIVSVISDDDTYQIDIVKNMYKTLLDMVKISDPIPETTVDNCYIEVE